MAGQRPLEAYVEVRLLSRQLTIQELLTIVRFILDTN